MIGGCIITEEFSCKAAGTKCPFVLRDENENELVSMVQQHALNAHNEKLSREDVLKYTRKK